MAQMKLKRAGGLTKILILTLLMCATVAVLGVKGQLEQLKLQQQTLQQQANILAAENKKLEEILNNSDSPETLEQVARESGLVKQGEIVFEDIAR